MKKSKAKKIISIISLFIALLLTLLNLIIYFTLDYVETNIGLVSIDEVIFHLKVPLQGTSHAMINDIIYNYVVPAIIIYLAISVPFFIRFNHYSEIEINIFKLKFNVYLKDLLRRVLLIANLIVLPLQLINVDKKFHVIDYIKLQKQNSKFIEKNYVDPKDVNLVFPDEKRNLIYIYVESMESTYMSKDDGGNQDVDLIPELTKLAKNNISFSDTKLLGGAYPINGTGWTMGGMVAHTAGVPLNLPIQGNAYDSYGEFLPGAYTLGDILKVNGYTNVLMLGSDSTFAGKKTYFKTHGNYIIKDYNTAVADNTVPKKYYQSWGLNDEYLFEYAKKELTELSKNNEPFNLTMLTANTHFPDGYVEDSCEIVYETNQYANSIICSSGQLYDFVKWIKKQEFYENTTIIIVGDHLSMAANAIYDGTDYSTRRIYNVFINSAVEASKTKNRKFTTLDLYPTTLASLGVEIDGNRLGLGTNLFSDKKTIIEENDYNYVNAELGKKSEYYNNKILYNN